MFAINKVPQYMHDLQLTKWKQQSGQ